MRIRQDEYEALVDVHKRLLQLEEIDAALSLGRILNRLDRQQEEERKANRERAAKNRAEGYKWKSSYHPKKSKYQEEAKR